MIKILWVALGAVWVAVLIPPLLRSRVDNRPNSSISDFRRHLTNLQRTVPTQRVAPMRAMARPLAQSGQQRTSLRVEGARAASLHRGSTDVISRGVDNRHINPRPVRQHRPAGAERRYDDRRDDLRNDRSYESRSDRHADDTRGVVSARSDSRYDDSRANHRPAYRDERRPGERRLERRSTQPQRRQVTRVSHREVVRRRRVNIVALLAIATAMFLFLALTTKANSMIVAFVVLMVALVGYCFQLSKLKQADQREQFAYSYRAA